MFPGSCRVASPQSTRVWVWWYAAVKVGVSFQGLAHIFPYGYGSNVGPTLPLSYWLYCCKTYYAVCCLSVVGSWLSESAVYTFLKVLNFLLKQYFYSFLRSEQCKCFVRIFHLKHIFVWDIIPIIMWVNRIYQDFQRNTTASCLLLSRNTVSVDVLWPLEKTSNLTSFTDLLTSLYIFSIMEIKVRLSTTVCRLSDPYSMYQAVISYRHSMTFSFFLFLWR